jgi:signal peptidase II
VKLESTPTAIYSVTHSVTVIGMFRSAHSTPVVQIILACIAVDQATKWLAKRSLAPDGFMSFAGDTLRLQYAENTGAFLSFGSSLPEPWRHIMLTVCVAIFLTALLAYLFFSRSLGRHYLACLSLVCGGGISNLIDRIAYDGRVVDFLNVGIGPIRTGIFNVADMAITTGAILLLIDSFRKTPKQTPNA